MDGGGWWAAVHGVARSQTRLSNFTFTFHFHALEKEMASQEKEKSKGKSPLYKIKAATDLKKVLEERILNSKVEFTLGEVLGIAKK